VSAPELLLGDGAAVYGVGAVDDPQDPGPAGEIGERSVVADTGTTEDLDGTVDDRGR